MKGVEPHKVFLDHITTLIYNLLVNNPNYKGREWSDQVSLKETKERARYILEEIEKTKHLIEPYKEEGKNSDGPLEMDEEDTTKSMA